MNRRIKELMELHNMGISIFITSKECAEVMGITSRALANRRYRKENSPPYFRVGKLIRYKLADVVEWMEYEKVSGC